MELLTLASIRYHDVKMNVFLSVLQVIGGGPVFFAGVTIGRA